jgi:DNA-binding YbaB/EbfC family protein
MVAVEMNGQQQVLCCRIEQSLFDSGDREMVEELVAAACNQAIAKVKEATAEEMSRFAGGFDVPGLGDALARLSGNGAS